MLTDRPPHPWRGPEVGKQGLFPLLPHPLLPHPPALRHPHPVRYPER